MRIEGHSLGLVMLIGLDPWEHSSALHSVRITVKHDCDSLIIAIHDRGQRTAAHCL
jgi:hypothetical protein